LAGGGAGAGLIANVDRPLYLDPSRFRVRSRTCLFAGWQVRSGADTIIGGILKWRADRIGESRAGSHRRCASRLEQPTQLSLPQQEPA
jgi:hypothetical protein